MHQSSYEKMSRFVHRYLQKHAERRLRIYDLGSKDVNGCYKALFANTSWTYIGLDLEPGTNVDIVLKNPYRWREIKSNAADVVVSGQAFEHIQYFWITMLEVARVLKPGGLCCIIAPSSGPEHQYPFDCWRFYPDGMHALAVFAQLEVLEVSTQWNDCGYVDGSDIWHDTMLIGRKPVRPLSWMLKSSLKRWLQHRALTIGKEK